MFDRDVVFRIGDGAEKHCSITFHPIDDPTYGPAFYAWIYDLNERIELQNALRQAKETAEETLEQLRTTQAQLVESKKLAALGGLGCRHRP